MIFATPGLPPGFRFMAGPVIPVGRIGAAPV